MLHLEVSSGKEYVKDIDTLLGTNSSQFIFSIQIEKPLSDGGLEIEVFEPPEIQRMLLEIQKEGLIQLISNEQFRLTLNGIEYCKRLPETFG